jgi:CheY-like chemotaxis protein
VARAIGELRSRIQAGAADDGGPGPATAPHPAPSGQRRRILVAEDNPANQAILRMQLEVLGCEVTLAGDGATALAKWKLGAYDLILADRNMPGMDGLALTRSIRAAEREKGGHVPIVAVTALSQDEALAACRAAGMDGVLSKPIELDALRRLLDQWLGDRKSVV